MVGELRDDYQMKAAWFQLDRPSDGSSHKLVFELPAGDRIEQTLDLRQQRNEQQMSWELQPGDKVVMTVQSTDFFDLTPEGHLGQSDQFAFESSRLRIAGIAGGPGVEPEAAIRADD